jgi:hypothetical protein
MSLLEDAIAASFMKATSGSRSIWLTSARTPRWGSNAAMSLS